MALLCPTLQPHGLYRPWNSPGQNSGVGSCSLLQGIFPTQGSNPGLPHCRQILYQLSHQGSPTISKFLHYFCYNTLFYSLTNISQSFNILWVCFCCSVTKLCPILCDPTDYSTPGFPVLHYLPEFAQTPVHWVISSTFLNGEFQVSVFTLLFHPQQNTL